MAGLREARSVAPTAEANLEERKTPTLLYTRAIGQAVASLVSRLRYVPAKAASSGEYRQRGNIQSCTEIRHNVRASKILLSHQQMARQLNTIGCGLDQSCLHLFYQPVLVCVQKLQRLKTWMKTTLLPVMREVVSSFQSSLSKLMRAYTSSTCRFCLLSSAVSLSRVSWPYNTGNSA